MVIILNDIFVANMYNIHDSCIITVVLVNFNKPYLCNFLIVCESNDREW